MRFILFIIGLALSADGLYYGAVTGMGIGESLVVAMGVAFILWSVAYDAAKRNGFLKFLKRLFIFCMTLFVIYSCAVCVVGRMDNADYNEKYLIVPGAGLNGDKPSVTLENRLVKAAEYLNRNGSAKVIVSGGQGADEDVPEAAAMMNYLELHGIRSERIIPEAEAESTYENFAYSVPMTDGSDAAFITNDFHVVRASMMAKLNGMNAKHIAAPTPPTLLPVCCAREMAAQIASIRYYF